MRLGAEAHKDYHLARYSPSKPERLKNPDWPRRMTPEDEADSMPETLKLLALLVVRRRNVLPSSRGLK
jgi:hypothetical protein